MVPDDHFLIFFLRWYQGFDWEGLEARTLTPPIIPKVRIEKKICLRFCIRFILLERTRESNF